MNTTADLAMLLFHANSLILCTFCAGPYNLTFLGLQTDDVKGVSAYLSISVCRANVGTSYS